LSANQTGVNQGRWDYVFALSGPYTQVTETRFVANVRGQDLTLHSTVSTDISGSNSSTKHLFIDFGQCAPTSSDTDTARGHVTAPDPSTYVVQTARAPQGYAVLGDGKIVASQPILVRQSDGSYQTQGVWSYLSDGSLRETIPQAPDGANYAPVGLLK
jgi:hypothetical protein